jgi:hypothetical protein
MSWTRIKVVGGGSGGRVLGRRRKGAATATFGRLRLSPSYLWTPLPFSCLLLRVRLLRFLFIASPFVWYTDGCLIVAQNSGDPSLYAYLYVRSTGTAELWA